MRDMKILHLADLHLGKRVNEMSMIEDQKYILDQIITLIKEESVGIVLLCGDIYDKSIPTIEAIHLLDEFLDQLSKMAIKVLMISGNHDSIDRLSFGKSLFTRSNLYIASQFENEIEKITVKENGITVNFYMLPFVKSAYISHIFQLQTDSYEECFRYLIEHTKIDEEETNILLSHQFVTANKKNPELSDSETSSLGGIDNIDFHIFDPFDYVALGHIHKPEIIFEDLMAYSGSLEPLDRTETGSHGFIEGEISEEKQQIEFVPFAKRMYIQVEVMITEEMSASEIKDRIETELSYRGKDNIYEVVLTGSIDPEIEIDFDDIKEDYLISDIIYETKSRWDYDQLAEENDLMIQKVAEILKEEPQALTFAMEALSYARER